MTNSNNYIDGCLFIASYYMCKLHEKKFNRLDLVRAIESLQNVGFNRIANTETKTIMEFIGYGTYIQIVIGREGDQNFFTYSVAHRQKC